ncbi:MAG: hypothetical protein M5R40_16415 [Anaerolineae bacterium]|nr:hypothetical protein [Anaerolineae bacterium]
MSASAGDALQKQNVEDLAKALDTPWVTYRMGAFADLAVDLYICEGTMAMHRHLHEDELFLVYDGSIVLGTERGDLTLRTEELMIVPKGTAHYSSAFFPATVVLLRPAGDALRKNGQWRLFAIEKDPPLEKVNLGALYSGLDAPYQPVQATRFAGWGLWVMRCAGVGPNQTAPESGTPLLILRGVALLLTEANQAMPLRRGDLLAIPPGVRYHLEADAAAMAVWLAPIP